MQPIADSIWYNGKIYTACDDFPTAEALAVKDGKILDVGTVDEVMRYRGTESKAVDLRGNTVLPGLNDAHIHFLTIGENMTTLNCYWKPKEEILELVREAASKTPKGKWIIGWGWNHAVWSPPEFPSKAELDAAAPDNPVMLERACEHVMWLNSRALECSGISEEIQNPDGGEFLRGADGRLTGLVTDQAQMLVREAMPPYSRQEIKAMLLAAQQELVRWGVTSATDAGIDLPVIECMKELYAAGELKVRLDVMVRRAKDRPVEEVIERTREWLKAGKKTDLFGGRLQVRCLKISADGSLGGRSAWMLEDYCDRAGHKGNGKLTDGELYTLVSEAHAAGMQVSVHAIGDAANRQTLDVFEKVLKERPCADHRFRIEHSQIVSPEDFPRFAALGVIPSMQTVHAASDMNMAEERLGLKRLEYAYAWRKFMDAGLPVPNGTDAPVEEVNPWLNFYAAVTRKDKNGNRREGWHEADAMSRREALLAYTVWPAYASFNENVKGPLTKGMYADFTVIDRDVMSCPEEDILGTKVLETVIAGETVYKAE